MEKREGERGTHTRKREKERATKGKDAHEGIKRRESKETAVIPRSLALGRHKKAGGQEKVSLRWTSRGTRMAGDAGGLDCGAVRLGRLPPQHPENVGTLNSCEGCHCQATGCSSFPSMNVIL